MAHFTTFSYMSYSELQEASARLVDDFSGHHGPLPTWAVPLGEQSSVRDIVSHIERTGTWFDEVAEPLPGRPSPLVVHDRMCAVLGLAGRLQWPVSIRQPPEKRREMNLEGYRGSGRCCFRECAVAGSENETGLGSEESAEDIPGPSASLKEDHPLLTREYAIGRALRKLVRSKPQSQLTENSDDLVRERAVVRRNRKRKKALKTMLLRVRHIFRQNN